jgi:Ca-activated chloride channel family protein
MEEFVPHYLATNTVNHCISGALRDSSRRGVMLVLQRIAALGLCLALLAAPATSSDLASNSEGWSPETRPEMTIRKTVEEVRIGFHVSFRNGRPVPELQPGQFSVYQDGQAITALTGFYADQNLPLRLLLMIDASDSMTRGFASERKAAADFLERMVRPDVDQSAVVAFSTHASIQLGANVSASEKLRLIGDLHSSGLTALFDSICEATARIPAYDQGTTRTRRVLVLLSDGDDNYSLHSLQDTIAAAQKSDVVIYAISPRDPRLLEQGRANLEVLTAATGGRVFFLKKYEKSPEVFAQIEREIRSEYAVTFHPEGKLCGFHSVRVEPADRNLRTRFREGFYGDCL